MHWPAPIAEKFSGRGALLTVVPSALALVFAALIAKWIGIAILVVVILVVLVVELWVESGRLTRELTDANDERDRMRQRADSARASLDAADEKLLEMSEIEGKVVALAEHNNVLRRELASRFTELPKLLRGLIDQATVIQLVRRHRTLAHGRPGRWAILSVQPHEDGNAQIVSYAGGSCGYAAGELVVIIDVSSGEVYASGVAAIEDQQLIVSVELDYLPERIRSDLQRLGRFEKEGYAVEMAGLAVNAYVAAADEDLELLEDALNEAMGRIGEALNPVRIGQKAEAER